MMDTAPIRICEWSSVDASAIPVDVRRDIAAAAEAWRKENGLPLPPLAFGGADGTTMTASHYVGVVDVHGCTVEIYPKLDSLIVQAAKVESEEAASSVMRHLLWMIEVAGFMDLAEADAAQLDVTQITYYDLFAYLLAKNLLRELERGVIHNYVGTEENTPTIRGRIDLLRQCTRNWGRGDIHFCRWDEFTPDTPLNRLFKCATLQLQPRVRNPEPALLLANCAALLNDVSNVEPSAVVREARIRWDRSNDRFRRSYDMARRLLAGSAYEMSSGQEDVFVFLLNMNHVFESFVASVVSARFGVPVIEQESIGHLLFLGKRKLIQQQPDLQWNVGEQPWVGDAKYKRLLDVSDEDDETTSEGGTRLGAADARQLTCYAGIVGQMPPSPSLAVFYPLVGDRDSSVIQYRTWNDCRLCLVPVRVDRRQTTADVIPSGAWMTGDVSDDERKSKGFRRVIPTCS
jgi:5-methylcytosine-specific restriction enzyme subunit McrC